MFSWSVFVVSLCNDLQAVYIHMSPVQPKTELTSATHHLLREIFLLHHFCDVTQNLKHSFLAHHLKDGNRSLTQKSFHNNNTKL